MSLRRDRLGWLSKRGSLGTAIPRVAVLIVAAVIVLAGSIYGFQLWRWYRVHESTDDAYVTARIAPLSARINGTVVEVKVEDNQDVKKGDLLVRLDPRDYEVATAQARAAAAAARAELANARANLPLTDQTTASQVRQASSALSAVEQGVAMARHELEQRRSELNGRRAAVAAAEAAVRAAEADFARTRLDRDRLDRLVQGQLVARQDFDHAVTAFHMAEALLDAARRRLEGARSDAAETEARVRAQEAAVAQARERTGEGQAALAVARGQREQMKVRAAQVDVAEGRLAQALADLQQAELNLAYTTIRAPVDGRVSRKNVEPGQVVRPGQQLLALVDLNDVWVVANFKETQLTRMRPGQAATVTVDAYPGVVFRARVESIQGGSGAVFSLLPPQNATGNFVKVVQRVPVKLVLEPDGRPRHLLVPGMSVVPTVELR